MKLAKWLMVDDIACGAVRALAPAYHINREGGGWRLDCKKDLYGCDVPGTDLVVFQCEKSSSRLSLMRELQARGIACVYDIDDNWLCLDETSPFLRKGVPLEEWQETMKQFMLEADLVVCSTPELDSALREYVDIPRAVIVRNA